VIDVAGAHAGRFRNLRDAGAVEAVLAEALLGGCANLDTARFGARGVGVWSGTVGMLFLRLGRVVP
jgi:hypothetical protein